MEYNEGFCAKIERHMKHCLVENESRAIGREFQFYMSMQV